MSFLEVVQERNSDYFGFATGQVRHKIKHEVLSFDRFPPNL